MTFLTTGILLFLSLFFVSCGGSSSYSPSLTLKTLLIPLYSHPTTSWGEYERLLNTNTNKEVYVVINPSDGVGPAKDPNYESVINQLKQKGFVIFGYFPTEYGRRSIEALKSEMERWTNFYPQIDGFFVDEVSNNFQLFSYYQQVYNHAKGKGKAVILNPGTKVQSQFYSIADKVVVFEQSLSFLRNNYTIDTVNDKDCYLVYDVQKEQLARETLSHLLNKGISCVYLLDESPPSWFKLSPYMEVMLSY
jgi:hypothetical protein